MFVMRICNGFNGLLLVGTAVSGFFLPSGGFEVEADNIVLSAYLVFLGLLMCILELNVAFVQSKLRKNFGALFSYSGRTIFLLFCSSVSAALGTRATYGLMWIVAGLTGFNALWNLVVICRHKEFTSGEGLVGGADPYAQSKSLERAMIDFLVSRPQVAAAVVSTLSRQAVANLPPEAQVAVAHLAKAGQHLGNVAAKAGKEAAAVGAVVAAPMIAGGVASADRAARVAKAMAGRPMSDIHSPEVQAAIGIATRDAIPEAPLPLHYTVGPSVQGGISGLAREGRAGIGGAAPMVVVHNTAHMLGTAGGGAGAMPQPVPIGGPNVPPMGLVGLSQGIVEALNNPFLGGAGNAPAGSSPGAGAGVLGDSARARARTGTATGVGIAAGLPPSGYGLSAGGGSPVQPYGTGLGAGGQGAGIAANPYRSREPSAVNTGRASPAGLYAPAATLPPASAAGGGAVANPYARPAAGYGAAIGHRVPADADTSFGDGYGDENPFG